jgi:hypothetical protein
MPPTGIRLERRISAVLLIGVNLAVIGALIWLYVTIETTVFPRAGDVSTWIRIGYPAATCIAIVHFGRRAWQAYKRFRAS